MKKNLLFIPIALLALTACGGNKGSNVSTDPSGGNTGSDFIDPSASSNTSGSLNNEHISSTALSSIISTFTVEGSQVIIDTETNEVYNGYDIKYAFGKNAIEVSVGELDGDEYDYTEQMFKVSNNGESYASSYYLDATNTVRSGILVDEDGYPIEWTFDNTLKYTVATKDFDKIAENTFIVNSQSISNNIASVLGGYFYDSSYPAVSSMIVTVENDVITHVAFETEQLQNLMLKFDLTISGHGETEVVNTIQPYASYNESAALGSALAEIGRNVTVTIDATNGIGQSYNEVVTLTDKSYSTSIFNAVVAEFDGLSGCVLLAKVDEDDYQISVFDPDYDLLDYGYAYLGNLISPLMFEYKNGKYVTRNEMDAMQLTPYLVPSANDFTGIITEFSITLNNGKLETIDFDGDYSGTITYSKIGTTVGPDLSGIADKVMMWSRIDESLLGTWQGDEKTLVIEYENVTIDSEVVTVTDINGGVINGTLGGQQVTITLTDDYIVELVIGEDTFTLDYDTYFVFVQNLEAMGGSALPRFADDAIYEFQYTANDGMVAGVAYKDVAFTLNDLTTWVSNIVDNETYYDITDASSDSLFEAGSSTMTVAEFMGQNMLNIDSLDYVFVELDTEGYIKVVIGLVVLDGYIYFMIL